MTRTFFLIIFLAFIVPATRAGAEMFPYTLSDTVEGTVKVYKVKPGESLIEIARKFGLGYNEIIEANPGLDPFVPGDGVVITVPTSWILPDTGSPEGIFINLSEFRLYYFFGQDGARFVETFPIGIGSEGHDTPVGVFKVIEKIVNPAWHVPESIRLEKPELPKVVPPGPDNPLGTHALRLSDPSILMHGTNRPFAVGRMASHGCIRLYPEDIPRLFTLAPKGVSVTIVRQPIKVGVKEKRIFIEVHNDPKAESTFIDAVNLLRRKGLLARANLQRMNEALEKKDGTPTDITEYPYGPPSFFAARGPIE
jgi:L,D-transpeptidase ErfK/SrfK